MTDLINVIVSIKDPFTLLAFFAVVLLIALPPGGDDFETSSLLVPCVYMGQFDVESSKPTYISTMARAGTSRSRAASIRSRC